MLGYEAIRLGEENLGDGNSLLSIGKLASRACDCVWGQSHAMDFMAMLRKT